LDKIRLGIIGTGFALDRLHFPALQKLKNEFEIAAVCNKTIDKAQGFAGKINLSGENVYDDYKKMLERTDLDAIDVLVPISENYEVARDVLQAKKHLIAEKPFASTPEGARELIGLKDKAGVLVQVAENFRYDEGNQKIKELLASGKIGDVLYFMQNTGADFEKEQTQDTFAAKEWRQHPAFEGGIFLDGGIHDMARLRYFFGDVKEVFAHGRPQQKEYCEYSVILSLLSFESGLAGQYAYYPGGSELSKPPVGLRIFGSLGDIYLESKESGKIKVSYKDGKSEEISFAPGMGYENELRNFYEAFRNSRKIESTPEKELGDIELIYAILRAARKGERVPVKCK